MSYHRCLFLCPIPSSPLTRIHPIFCILFQQSFFSSSTRLPVLSFFHHSQKMLVMSESRLKIQINSGAEIRTKDQETPFSDWRSPAIMAPTNPVLGPILRCSSSSSRDFLREVLQQRRGLGTDHFELQITQLHNKGKLWYCSHGHLCFCVSETDEDNGS